MKTWIPLLTLFLLLCGCGKTPDDKEAISQAFNDYKTAILATDGESAASKVTASTLTEYQRYIDLCKSATRKELEELTIMPMLQVFLMKHRIPTEELLALDGESAFVYAVKKDWIGRNSVTTLSIGDVRVDGNTGSAAVMSDGQEIGIRFHFIKENGDWKFDLTKTMKDTEPALSKGWVDSGNSLSEYVIRIVTITSGREVDETIWEPLQKEAPASVDAPPVPDGSVDIVLTAAGPQKIMVIKLVREISGLGLKDAKDLVDNTPSTIKTGLPLSAANDFKKKFTEAGAAVELKAIIE